MRGLFTPKNVDFCLSRQCFRLWFVRRTPPTSVCPNSAFDFGLSEQCFRLWFVETVLSTLFVGTSLLIFVCQCTDKLFFDRLTREEITGGITVD